MRLVIWSPAKKDVIVITALAFCFVQFAFSAEPPGDLDKNDPNALVREILNRLPAENTEILGLLKIRPADGPITEIPTKMSVRVSGNLWEDRYETQPVPGRAGEVLLIRHHGTQPSEYLYGHYQKRGDQPKLDPLKSTNIFQSFARSDLYLADLGLEFFHWPSQKIVKKEMRHSRSCRVLESINPNPAATGYSRVLSWIDFETSNLIMAQGYDSRNRLLKEFSIRKISRTEGKAQLKEIEIRNDQSDSRTRLEFNFDLPQASQVPQVSPEATKK